MARRSQRPIHSDEWIITENLSFFFEDTGTNRISCEEMSFTTMRTKNNINQPQGIIIRLEVRVGVNVGNFRGDQKLKIKGRYDPIPLFSYIPVLNFHKEILKLINLFKVINYTRHTKHDDWQLRVFL